MFPVQCPPTSYSYSPTYPIHSLLSIFAVHVPPSSYSYTPTYPTLSLLSEFAVQCPTILLFLFSHLPNTLSSVWVCCPVSHHSPTPILPPTQHSLFYLSLLSSFPLSSYSYTSTYPIHSLLSIFVGHSSRTYYFYSPTHPPLYLLSEFALQFPTILLLLPPMLPNTFSSIWVCFSCVPPSSYYESHLPHTLSSIWVSCPVSHHPPPPILPSIHHPLFYLS